MTGRAEQITGPIAYHGEGPVWVDQLHWVDMLAGDVLSLGSDGTVGRRHVGPVVAALRPRASGGFVYALERGFALDDGIGTPIQTLPDLWTTDAVRMNEGGCDPDGRFYCGSMAYAETPGAASLYRLDPDGRVTTVLGDLTVSNGLEWSPDGRLAYYVDSATGRIDVWDYEGDRGLTGRRPFATVEVGAPDGLTVDAEGGSLGRHLGRQRRPPVHPGRGPLGGHRAPGDTGDRLHLRRRQTWRSCSSPPRGKGCLRVRSRPPGRCSTSDPGSPAGQSASSPAERHA